ncbi:MAG: hypothetical protein GOV00_02400 [Candidatus Altiarchaeota archaeon]|nr:hypothetical protein [Candidatus Altiarchaeota archaeon]
MILILSEKFGVKGALARFGLPILDRLVALGRSGYLTSEWEPKRSSKFLWGLLSTDGFPGEGPLKAISQGISVQGRAIALAKFVNINKKGAVVEELKAPQDLKLKVGSFDFELKTLKNQSFIIYSGSEKIQDSKIEGGIVKKVEPLEAGAKQTAKALRTFANMMNEKTGKFPILTGFGRIRRTPLKVNASIFADSKKLSGVTKMLGLKKVNSFEALIRETGLKVAVFSETKLDALDKLSLPLVGISEKETVMVMGIPKDGLDQPMFITGPKIIPDLHKKFDGSQNGARYSQREIAKMLKIL